VFEWSDVQRHKAFQESLHIEIDIEALREHDISGSDIGPEVQVDPDVIDEEAEPLVILERFEDRNSSEDSEMRLRSDEEYLAELKIRAPPVLQGPRQDPLNDDSFDGGELVEAVNQGQHDGMVRREEAARPNFREEVDLITLPLPQRPLNSPPAGCRGRFRAKIRTRTTWSRSAKCSRSPRTSASGTATWLTGR
jgi:hypothetical protein